MIRVFFQNLFFPLLYFFPLLLNEFLAGCFGVVMAKKIFILIVLAAGLFYFYRRPQNLPFLSFNDSMKKGNAVFENIYSSQNGRQWKIVQKLYEKHLREKPSNTPRIPKIIHQIWLGGPLPEKYYPLQKSWQEKHPDWEYRLWTDADITSFPFMNRERFENAVNVGEKADIFRYEILYLYGGLYVDTDFECIRPVDELHYLCDLYTGILGAFAEGQEVAIGNALIGAKSNHPIIQYCIEWVAKKPIGRTADEVQALTGPGCFKRAFFKRYDVDHLRNVAFPYTFFYPLPSEERCGHLDGIAKSKWIEPETFGIHYWDTSWAKNLQPPTQ